jgi:hypothetical protein
MTTAVASDTRIKTITRQVQISGIRPLMFDRYAGDNDTKLSWTEKIYLIPGTDILCLPTTNINSFFTAHNTPSAPKRLLDKRKYKDVCNAIQSFVIIEGEDNPEYIAIQRDGKPITVGEFGVDRDAKSGLYLHRSVARLDKGIPNPKERPTLPCPWSMRFTVQILENNAIKESTVRQLLVDGGIAIGLGTYRGTFGKFVVDFWK